MYHFAGMGDLYSRRRKTAAEDTSRNQLVRSSWSVIFRIDQRAL